MRILITNDDGINAPGLAVLDQIATDLAGPSGEVRTVATAFEQSGVGHCISYTHPMMVAKMGERRYAAEGSPAGCVLAGLHHVMGDLRPDLILLDEPMAGMNLEEKEDMARYIIALHEEWGMTVVMIEHDMGVGMGISHRVVGLDFGKKIASGLPDEVMANPQVRKAYLGEDDEPSTETELSGEVA